MQTSSRDGISCDKCGMTYKIDFEYMSFDFRIVSVSDNRRPPLNQIFSQPVDFSLDICTSCFDGIKKDIIRNYAAVMVSDTKHRGRRNIPIVCEITGEKLTGTFEYYHCNVVKVVVRMSDQLNVCVKCNTKTSSVDKACVGCGGSDFIRPANIVSHDRFVEFNLGEPAFRSMVDTASTLRRVAGEWVTKSTID